MGAPTCKKGSKHVFGEAPRTSCTPLPATSGPDVHPQNFWLGLSFPRPFAHTHSQISGWPFFPATFGSEVLTTITSSSQKANHTTRRKRFTTYKKVTLTSVSQFESLPAFHNNIVMYSWTDRALLAISPTRSPSTSSPLTSRRQSPTLSPATLAGEPSSTPAIHGYGSHFVLVRWKPQEPDSFLPTLHIRTDGRECSKAGSSSPAPLMAIARGREFFRRKTGEPRLRNFQRLSEGSGGGVARFALATPNRRAELKKRMVMSMGRISRERTNSVGHVARNR